MASAFTHGFVGLALARVYAPGGMPLKFWIAAALCGIIPDADAIGYMLGVRYESMFGHRGFTHSLLFALLLALLVVLLIFREIPSGSARWWGLLVFFFVVTASHAVLDAMTTGGLGVAFFSPFRSTRYFFPWRPIRVSPIGVTSFFSEWGLRVLASELLWVWLPLAVLVLIVLVVRRVTDG